MRSIYRSLGTCIDSDIVWKTARPKLEALIKQKHEDDRQGEFEARIRERYEEFRPIYEGFVRVVIPEHLRNFAPNWADACRLPCIVELASSDGAFPRVTYERVAAIGRKLATEVLRSIIQIRRDLAEMLHREHRRMQLRDAQPMPYLEVEQVNAELAKATSLFVCHHCPLTTAVSASLICHHWRTEHAELKWNDGWPIDERSNRRQRLAPRPWICVMPGGPLLAEHALKAFGLPEDTPFALLDDSARRGRLVCLCGSPRLRASRESGWGTLVRVTSMAPLNRYLTYFQISHVNDEQDWYSDMLYSMCVCFVCY